MELAIGLLWGAFLLQAIILVVSCFRNYTKIADLLVKTIPVNMVVALVLSLMLLFNEFNKLM